MDSCAPSDAAKPPERLPSPQVSRSTPHCTLRAITRYWLAIALILAATLTGIAAYQVYDRGTATPHEPPSGSVTVATTKSDVPITMEVGFVTFTEPHQTWLQQNLTFVGDPPFWYEPYRLTDIEGTTLELSGRMKPHEQITWELGLHGTARLSETVASVNQRRVHVDVATLLDGSHQDQWIRGTAKANKSGRFTIAVSGRLAGPITTSAGGVTYLRVPSYQTAEFSSSMVDGRFLLFQDNMTITVAAGMLRAGETVTSVYPDVGLQRPPVTDPRPHENDPGLALRWTGKALPTMRAEVTDRQQQRNAGRLTFISGGLLGLATAMLLEALLLLQAKRQPADTPSPQSARPPQVDHPTRPPAPRRRSAAHRQSAARLHRR